MHLTLVHPLIEVNKPPVPTLEFIHDPGRQGLILDEGNNTLDSLERVERAGGGAHGKRIAFLHGDGEKGAGAFHLHLHRKDHSTSPKTINASEPMRGLKTNERSPQRYGSRPRC